MVISVYDGGLEGGFEMGLLLGWYVNENEGYGVGVYIVDVNIDVCVDVMTYFLNDFDYGCWCRRQD